jgi:hypothetical protein
MKAREHLSDNRRGFSMARGWLEIEILQHRVKDPSLHRF